MKPQGTSSTMEQNNKQNLPTTNVSQLSDKFNQDLENQKNIESFPPPYNQTNNDKAT
eukprot:jgi/Orpsp1_1/1179706/evm.model.c7180000070432.1